MSNYHHLYNQHHQTSPPPAPAPAGSNIYSAARSAVSNKYLTDTSSRYYLSDHHSLSSYTTPSSTVLPSYSDYPFDVSSTYSKRPSQALYSYSSLGAHMLGQSEAWLTSDSLAKRPKLKSACLPVYPQRPGEKDCAHYMLTRTCRFGDTCKFDHPIWVPDGGISDWKEMQLLPVPSDFHPERPGELDCPYFLKTQKCKFGLNCKFNHPKDKMCTSDKNETADLPERLSEPQCSFYVKTGKCKFGASCKFNHPKDIQIPSDGQEALSKEQTKPAGAGNGNCAGDGNEIKTFMLDPPPFFNSKGLPVRLGEVDCPFYMKTGSCKYAANCRYNHPDRNDINPPIPNLAIGLLNPAASILQSLQPSVAQTLFGPGSDIYPQRPGQPECDHFMKAGVCKYGETCKFHHPIDRSAPKLTLAGLPRREGVSNCSFYMKTGTCRFGPTCRFDHPPPGEVMASEGEEKTTVIEEAKLNEENVENIGE